MMQMNDSLTHTGKTEDRDLRKDALETKCGEVLNDLDCKNNNIPKTMKKQKVLKIKLEEYLEDDYLSDENKSYLSDGDKSYLSDVDENYLSDENKSNKVSNHTGQDNTDTQDVFKLTEPATFNICRSTTINSPDSNVDSADHVMSGLLIHDAWDYSMLSLNGNKGTATIPRAVITPNNNKDEKKYGTKNLCSICGKAFERAYNLTRHMRIHTDERAHKCRECGHAFRHEQHLKVHLRTHTGEKPYRCEDCGRSFSQSGNYKNHVRIHTGERPYGCEDCGKSFARKTDFTKHVRIHTGEKPYKCEYCGKRFTVKQNLNCHVRVHTGEKPFKCIYCDKSFRQACGLKTHVNKHKE